MPGGRDPRTANALDSRTGPDNPDTDGYGLNDGTDIELGFDPLDPDSDGVPDRDER